MRRYRSASTAVSRFFLTRAFSLAVVVTAALCTVLATAGCERSQPGPKPISGEAANSVGGPSAQPASGAAR